MTNKDDICPECLNAIELGDGTMICAAFSRYLENNVLYIQELDDSVDWEKCTERWTEEDEARDAEEEDDEADEEEAIDDWDDK